MHSIVIDLLLCGFIYGILLAIIFVRESKKKRGNDSDGDDEGGLPVLSPPEIDLPPGVCLPDDPRVKKQDTTEEVFA